MRWLILPFVAAPTYTIRALDRSTWPAFAALVEHNNGIFGGCWCMAFHPEGGDRAAQGELNRERKHERVCAGTAHAATRSSRSLRSSSASCFCSRSACCSSPSDRL